MMQLSFKKALINYIVFIFISIALILMISLFLDYKVKVQSEASQEHVVDDASLPLDGVAGLHDDTYSSSELQKFSGEFLVSVLMVASFMATRWSLKLIGHKIVEFRSRKLSKLLIKWDSGETSEEEVKEELLLLYLNKWVVQENEVGWYELSEFLSGSQKIRSQQATRMIKKELQRVERLKDFGGAITRQRNTKYQEKLMSVLPCLIG